MLTGLLAGGIISLSACTGTSESATAQDDLRQTETVSTFNTEKIMDIATIKNQYALQAGLFDKVTAGISDEEASQRINENTNSLAWIAGHTLWIQYNLAALVGAATDNPYAEQFAFGTSFDPDTQYPSLEKMRRDWNALSPKISQGLDQLTAEQLQADSPFPIPFPEQSVRGLWGFQMHHLGYEIGQMALYRRFLGKEAMSYQ